MGKLRYNSLFFRCPSNEQGLRASDSNLGLAPSVVGDSNTFETRNLTLEFKNNLDGLVSDIDDETNPKQYQHIDICVCWSTLQDAFSGYELKPVGPANLDQRRYPGTTHLLQRDGESHTIEVVMLRTVRELVESGDLPLE